MKIDSNNVRSLYFLLVQQSMTSCLNLTEGRSRAKTNVNSTPEKVHFSAGPSLQHADMPVQHRGAPHNDIVVRLSKAFPACIVAMCL